MKKIADAFLFSSVFIAVCALLMVAQTFQLLHLSNLNYWYYLFIAGGTIASYNLHWHFTDINGSNADNSVRLVWTLKHKNLLIPLAITGLLIAAVSFYFLKGYWYWIFIGAGLAFLYTAPKIPGKLSLFLRKIAIAKTIYLSLAWTYVTAVLPIIISGQPFTITAFFFLLHRYFFLYALCVLFDIRDREDDIKQGIRSLITFFNDRGIAILFYLSAATSIITANVFAYMNKFSLPGFLLSLPLLIAMVLFPFAKKSKNDYLYYFVLDGLMPLSFLFTCFQHN